MANFYLDLSAIGNEYQAYAATPVWGPLATDKPQPMDGNGKGGPGHSAAVSIAEIKLNALPADTNTLVIAGATITAKTTVAAKNQFAIGASIAACVTNIVNLLNTFGTGSNQCDATVNVGSSALLLALPYFQFARVKPGATDTVQIATRIAGSDLNQASNNNVLISHSGWSAPPTFTQFAGGADGPFAYAVFGSTVFGKTLGTYGCWTGGTAAVTNPTSADIIHVRTARDGSNIAKSVSFASAISVNWRSSYYLYDDGAIWSGDNGVLSLTILHSVSSSVTVQFNLIANTVVEHVCKTFGKFEIIAGVTTAGSGALNIANASGSPSAFAFLNCKFIESSLHLGGTTTLNIYNTVSSIRYLRCDLSGSFIRTRGVSRDFVYISATTPNVVIRAINTTFEVLAATGPIGAFIAIIASNAVAKIDIIGGQVRDSNGVYSCLNPIRIIVNTAQILSILIDNVAGVTDASAGFLYDDSCVNNFWWNQSEGPIRAYRHETQLFMVDWKGDGTFPHCGSQNLQGDYWAHRVSWNSTPGAHILVDVLNIGDFYRDSSAIKTLTVELYNPNSTQFYIDEFELTVTYIDSSNVRRTESIGRSKYSRHDSSRSVVPSSSKVWTENGVANYSAEKLEITTQYPIKSNSEVSATLSLCASRSSPIVFYVSPEITFS